MKEVLVLGAGRVARPLLRYLLDQPHCKVTVASQEFGKAGALVDQHPDGSTTTLDINDTARLEGLIREHDLAISLLPAPLHPVVARLCVKHKRHMVTASYVSDAMRQLDEPAKRAGVMLLNEIGVDPGIDHMSAMRIIDDVRKRGGKVVSFKSYCGGLPAPDSNDNPWGYKFSWSPRAVCTVGKSGARYLLDGITVEIPGPKLFTDSGHGMTVQGLGELEAYPNRDSLKYIKTYGLEGISTMFRGTFRYRGWCETLKKVADLGLLEETTITYPPGTTYASFMGGLATGSSTGNVRNDVAAQLDLDPESPILDRFEWLGLFDNDEIAITGRETTPLDVLAARMEERMQYGKGQRDMIVLCHDFRAEFPNGPREHITSTLIDFGQADGDSSMARTVGLPAAVGSKLILTGEVKLPGVQIPVAPAIYNPVLNELADMGIKCLEKTEKDT